MKKLYQLLRNNAAAPAPLRAETANSEATLYIYDVIDSFWGVRAIDVATFLNTLTDGTKLNVRINSPGGDVFEARAISTAIKNYKGQKTVYIDGLAASAATTIALAGDSVEIAEGSFFMIHNAWTFAMGDKNSLLETADLLGKVDIAIAADYANKTGKDEKAIAELMDAETWMNAQEAVDSGFCDKLQESAKTQNHKRWNLAAYDNAPQIENEIPETNHEHLRAQNERRLNLFSRI